ncbi:hypothetical protein NA57DRAFT_72218 [Rhizodiscina lignyota]|uniref:Uncharacterized protein n=1 Tax=Rhizodiscina lignyota TaxID=1504668 RepID=A0A9P4MAG8_9PEZI|nr:hypothetical protein NA57DRAFT_72218 [Rhizodiscina lignyota]
MAINLRGQPHHQLISIIMDSQAPDTAPYGRNENERDHYFTLKEDADSDDGSALYEEDLRATLIPNAICEASSVMGTVHSLLCISHENRNVVIEWTVGSMKESRRTDWLVVKLAVKLVVAIPVLTMVFGLIVLHLLFACFA